MAFLQLKNLTANRFPGSETPSTVEKFSGRIDVKLSAIFISLFVLVLMVGGSSLYLLASHLFKSDEIAKQSDQLDIAESVSRRLESFTSMIQLALLRGQNVSHSQLADSSRHLDELLKLYEVNGGTSANIQQMRQMIGDAEAIASRIVDQQQKRQTLGREGLIHDLEAMETVQQRIATFIERLTLTHEEVEDKLVAATRRKMQISVVASTAILLMGTIFLIWLTRYCRRSIALPLRALAERSREIARGDFGRNVPVISRDEIGLLSNAFNQMATQLKAHEERSKGRAILEERERLAGELHDTLAQDLACIRIKLLDWEKRGAGKSTETTKLLDEVFPIVNEAYQNLRESIFGLRALAIKPEVGLIAALSDFLKSFSEVRDIPVKLRVDSSQAIRFEPQVEIQLIRIMHEALTNIVKHAHAKRIEITMECKDGKAITAIADDGLGFSPEYEVPSTLHFGVQMMRTRAESIGGRCSVASVSGRGTTVMIELPLAKSENEEDHAPLAG